MRYVMDWVMERLPRTACPRAVPAGWQNIWTKRVRFMISQVHTGRKATHVKQTNITLFSSRKQSALPRALNTATIHHRLSSSMGCCVVAHWKWKERDAWAGLGAAKCVRRECVRREEEADLQSTKPFI